MSALSLTHFPGLAVIVSDSALTLFAGTGRRIGLEQDPGAKVSRTASGFLASCGLLWPVDLSGFPGRAGGREFLQQAFDSLPDHFRASADAALGRQGEIKFCQAFYSIEPGPLATEYRFQGSYMGGAECEAIPLEAPGAAWRFFDNEPDGAAVSRALSFQGLAEVEQAADMVLLAWSGLFQGAGAMPPFRGFAASASGLFEVQHASDYSEAI